VSVEPGEVHTKRRTGRLAPRRAAVDVAAAALVATGVHIVLRHGVPGYDSSYALAWGNELAHGDVPRFNVPLAPTPHPLTIAVGAAVSPLGASGGTLMTTLYLLSFGALVVGTFRLGHELFSSAVGFVAAAVIATCVPLIAVSSEGISDTPAGALVVWALLLEVRQRRRGWPVLALLALAGLLRPEAWLLTGVYWLYLCRGSSWRARLGWAALAGTAPLVWMITDLVSTANPLWSLTGTRDLAEGLGRRSSIAAAPTEGPKLLAKLLGPGALIAAAAGSVVGLTFMRPRTLLVLTVAALNGLAFLAIAAAGLPLNGRYLLLAAVMAAMLSGVGAVGWVDNAEVRHRRRYLVAAALSAAMLLGGAFAFQWSRVDAVSDRLAREAEVRSDLTRLLGTHAARVLDRRCGPFDVPSSRVVPVVAYLTDRSADEVFEASIVPVSRRRPALVPRTNAAAETEWADPANLVEDRRGDRPKIAETRHWALRGRCGST
jgi:hypothetical protein